MSAEAGSQAPGAVRPGAAGLALAPGGGPAPAARRVLAQAAFDTRVLLRNGEQLLVSLVLPALALVALVRLPLGDLGVPAELAALPRVDVVVPGVLALAVVSTAFTGQAIQLGFDRRYGVLRLLATTPLGRGGLLAGRVLAVLAVEVLQVLVLGALGAALGWRPLAAGAAGLAALALALLAGTAAFVALALLLAGTLRAEAVLALANLVFLLLVAGGGLLLPRSALPGPLSAVVAVLPSGALGDAARAALLDGAVAVVPVLVLLAWAAAAAALVVRVFRWS
ncbi:ABC transporter permease [Quadrisphaera sp. DSM 44207]|uniref:ABC transporter permease n=1 Tax=Quadrisphaera sp. DSM 44207 TaxID=1881057 RepID=UPI00088BF96A|nr:ABC transporter permease [Quadrisphaera sp. DSM 44207]SDQ44056.1 ABC-2 type transport system permease protein [Quadrisphaera sp. DSM 44207]